jgi:hypothetical protein
MAARLPNHTSFMVVASVIVLTSIFSLKGLSSTTGTFKLEELAMFRQTNSARSKIHKPEKHDNDKRADFVLCRNCFWCASQIDMGAGVFDECPACKETLLATMTLRLDESFLSDCRTGGIDLAFRKGTDSASA